MKFYVGVTDNQWFKFHRDHKPEEVNFWKPGGQTTFKAIPLGAPFLFKLKQPYNVIGGVGFFAGYSVLPIQTAWEVFGNGNGVETYNEFLQKVISLRSNTNTFVENPNVGCTALTDPCFFTDSEFIPAPEDWASSIVQGKTYEIEDAIGGRLWAKVIDLVNQKWSSSRPEKYLGEINEYPESYYGEEVMRKARMGQASFRISVIQAYSKRCAMTGERTLPVLEAAHIKPFAQKGPNVPQNGLLLRSDLHKLFDSGYITVTPSYNIEVSGRIRIEFENGKEYYRLHGSRLAVVPDVFFTRPDKQFLDFHNTTIYRP